MLYKNKQAKQYLKVSCDAITSVLQQLDRRDSQTAGHGKTGTPTSQHLVLNSLMGLQPTGSLHHRDS